MTIFGKLRALLSRRDKKILFLLLGASFFVSFLETFSVSLIMLFASVATNFDLVFKNKYFSFVYKFLNCSSPSNFVVILGCFLILFYLFRGLIIASFTYAMSRFSQGRFKYFAFKFFQNYLNFNYKDYTANNSSSINKVIFADAGQITQILSAILIIFSEVLTVAFIYLTLLFVNWKMTAVLTVLLAVKIFFIIKAFSKRLAEAGKKSNLLNLELAKTFSEAFWSFKLIKLFSNEKRVLQKFDKAGSDIVKANTLNTVLQNSPRILLETMGFSLLIAIIIYVVYLYSTANGIIPVISMYAFAFYRFLPSANKIISSYNQIMFCRNAIDSVQTYLTYELEELGNEKVEFEKEIRLENFSFSYNEKNKILDSINLTIQKGCRTAFIGESGSGKSTIVDILMGLYKVTYGSIFIDNQELTTQNIKSWRNKIGYIPQQIYLFDGTIADNIVFGRIYNEQKIIESLKKANIYDFLLTQNGVNTKVGEGGILLSGGQKQRVAIARALYDDPELLVLDEATSALDNETEEKIMKEIYSLDKNKTLIIVAHRLSTVEKCDFIYKIENSKVSLVEDLHTLYNRKQDNNIIQKN
ncbi:MAG: ABC transporter ATP-binding protein [Candidatus Babeliales bacterium]